MDAVGPVSRSPAPQQKPREIQEKKPTEETPKPDSVEKSEERRSPDAGRVVNVEA